MIVLLAVDLESCARKASRGKRELNRAAMLWPEDPSHGPAELFSQYSIAQSCVQIRNKRQRSTGRHS